MLMCWCMSMFIDVCWYVLMCVDVCWFTVLMYVDVCWCVLMCVNVLMCWCVDNNYDVCWCVDGVDVLIVLICIDDIVLECWCVDVCWSVLMCVDLLMCVEVCWCVLMCVVDVLKCVEVCWCVLMCWCLLMCVDVCWCVLICVNVLMSVNVCWSLFKCVDVLMHVVDDCVEMCWSVLMCWGVQALMLMTVFVSNRATREERAENFGDMLRFLGVKTLSTQQNRDCFVQTEILKSSRDLPPPPFSLTVRYMRITWERSKSRPSHPFHQHSGGWVPVRWMCVLVYVDVCWCVEVNWCVLREERAENFGDLLRFLGVKTLSTQQNRECFVQAEILSQPSIYVQTKNRFFFWNNSDVFKIECGRVWVEEVWMWKGTVLYRHPTAHRSKVRAGYRLVPKFPEKGET
jgi:hypothetical protein